MLLYTKNTTNSAQCYNILNNIKIEIRKANEIIMKLKSANTNNKCLKYVKNVR